MKRFAAVPLVFQSDDDGPLRKQVQVDVGPGFLSISHTVDLGRTANEYAFAFRLCRGPSVLVLAQSWACASSGRSLPIRPRDVRFREGCGTRARLTIAPPWPLDFVIHLYGTAACDVQYVMQLFLEAAGPQQPREPS